MSQQHSASPLTTQQPSPQHPPSHPNTPQQAQQNQPTPGSSTNPSTPKGGASTPGHPSTPQQPEKQQQQPAQQVEQLDNITKVKSLSGPLRESLATTLKTAAKLLHHNYLADNGNLKGVDVNNPPRFDKHLEEFYSICDQIELHLKTSIQCIQQNTQSQRYLPMHVASTRIEPLPLSENGPLSYPQYLQTVRTQIGYAKDIHDTLICAAQNISPSE